MNQPKLLLGLIGADIDASRTPAMHEREGEAQGFRTLYQILNLTTLGLGPDDLPALLLAAERMGFAGLNITHPCKQAVIPHLTSLSAEAEALGAVNTVVLRQGERIGHNTDWWGYAEAFRRGMAGVAMDRVVQVGAGGAGAAVAHALLTLGAARLVVHDVDPARASGLAAALAARFPRAMVAACEDLAGEIAAADGLVNCTPIGMDAHPGLAVPAETLHAGLWVSEIIYFPLETPLLKRARALGCRTLSGGGMAVFQAVGAFKHFTGREPDADRMLQHFGEMVAA
jgi:shikimate dehydrogenase